MSQYTTGEMAKLCGVSVRTVQYYDSRSILVPSQLSEGGRRLYSQQDLEKLRIICFLRELGIGIDSIKKLLEEEHPERVIALLLEEQGRQLRDEIAQKQAQAGKLADAQRALRQMSQISVESIGDIACLMERKKQLRRLRITMLVLGFVMDAIEVSTLMVWIFTGIWLPFALGMVTVVALGVWISWLYFSRTVYICPECHAIFKPDFRQSFFARHTPYARKLTCPHCSYHGFCVETYGKEAPTC